MPSLTLSLARGAVTSPFKRAGRPDATLPTARLRLPAAPLAPGPSAAYRTICGFPATGPLPVTYPHVLAFPLAMRLMTRRDFPLPVTGLVHTWIEITAHRALQPEDQLELTVYAQELSAHRRGTEVTMVTEARLGGELVWESRSGYLSRHATRTEAPAPAAPSEPLPAVAEWRLPGDLGRRYGAASGDRNPIHLYPFTAKALGFPRHIAHGMWSLARCVASVENRLPDAVTVDASFRKPIFLPGSVAFGVVPHADGLAFALTSPKTGSPHVIGRTHPA